jgi:hypothetical protein
MSRAATVSRPRSRRWRWVVAGLLLLALLGAAALWLVLRGKQAEDALTSARAGVVSMRQAIQDGDIAKAQKLLPQVQADTADAVSATSDPVFRISTKVPVLGNTPAAVRSVSQAADDLANEVLPHLVDAGSALSPDSLRTSGADVNLSAFTDAAPLLDQAVTGLNAVSADLADVDTDHTPARVSDGVHKLQAQVDDVLHTTKSAVLAAKLLPPMLGGDGERRYLVALQSNAEERGTGGLLGSFGIVSAKDGRITLDELAPRSQLDSQHFNAVPLNFGKDYNALYGDDPAMWNGANMSPHYPYAAKLWLKMWQDRTGQRLDGVLTTDPVTLSYLLGVTGPVTVSDGTTFDEKNVVAFAENGIYFKYPFDDHRRDAYLQQITQGALTSVLGGKGNPTDLVNALGKSAGERRLLVYSDHPAQEKLIEQTAVSGAVPDDAAPFAGLGIINGAGSKLDYYLRDSLSYDVVGCDADGTRRTRITVTLKNTAPRENMPQYVDARYDLPLGPGGKPQERNGANFTFVQAYATRGATLVKATRDGQPLQVQQGSERGHPVYRAGVETQPGSTTTLVFDLTEPATQGQVQTFATPLVKDTPIAADDTQCGLS